MIEVNAVEAVPDFGLMLTFTSDVRRHFDMRPYLHYLVFRCLENPGYFCLAWVDYGTVDLAGRHRYRIRNTFRLFGSSVRLELQRVAWMELVVSWASWLRSSRISLRYIRATRFSNSLKVRDVYLVWLPRNKK